MKILFVCTDNVGRSVIAEYCLRHFLNDEKIENIIVESAGINAGSDISGFSMAHFPELKKFGIDASDHKRTQLTKKILEDADIVIAFDFSNIEAIEKEFDFKPKLFNQIYKNEETPLKISGPNFSGTMDERMVQATHYIFDATPVIWKKISEK
ncbi:MAG: hypothetical protein WCP91_00610 [Candidatus Berkelbacteria bacterium]